MARGLFKRGGVWWLRYSDGFGKIIRASAKTTNFKEAQAKLENQRKAIRDGEESEAVKKMPSYTFSHLAEEYIKWCEKQKSFNSKKYLINDLIETFGKVPLSRLSVMLIEQFQSDVLNKGKKPATVNRLIATLKHAIHKGCQWEMLSEETLKRVREIKFLKENNKRLRYLSKEECQTLLDNCHGHLKAIVTFAMNTGCRRGEILSLKWEQVDLKHGFILLNMTKNGERREIPINSTLRQTLQGLTRRLDIPYVFYDSVTCKPYGDVKRSFNTALRKAGIRDFHFHDIRHNFASHLVMSGVDITTVSKLLGHQSLTMTLRYAHLAPSHMVKAVDILDRTLTGSEVTQKVHILGQSR